uniref:Histone deacetylase domain-containing protein n=1 Tax=Dunaliella tertiolecta TaxID=3047 RepID=A0A6S8IVI8_DUNTE|mmetsp:Transcript_1288/g.2881  ORF Transcript_1288/g.2881 Transcript_1288/m.2881 type:complete len:905 (+) Transcript_1288:1501-4215(+)
MKTPVAFVLHNAAEAGDAGLLQRLLLPEEGAPSAATELGLPFSSEALKELLSLKDLNDCTPLHLAILNGHVSCAEVLLKAGSSPNKCCDGNPPLHMAVCTALLPGRAESAHALVQLLLAAGAQATKTDDGWRSAVHWAAEVGLRPSLELLLQACQKEQDQQLAAYREAAAADAAAAAEAAHEAAGEGGAAPVAVKDVQLPSTLPSVVEMQDADGNTPLHAAVRVAAMQGATGNDGAVELLLTSGQGWDVAAVVRTRNNDSFNALHLAALHNRLSAVQAICAAVPSAVSVTARKAGTAAHFADKRGYKDIAAFLEKVAASKPTKARAPAAPGPQPPLLIIAPEECHMHYTAPDPIVRGAASNPPPENVGRLHVLTRPDQGILHAREFAHASWETKGVASVAISDVLRCHEWSYVRGLLATCSALPNDPTKIGRLDPDTTVSHLSGLAALKAAGAVCTAVDRILAGQARSVFCPVRPPGHHAGPTGSVPSANDPAGSHGFCLLSNVAIGAAYALNVHRHQGIGRVAILDFDVHHGNGTQAVVANTQPSTQKVAIKTPFSEGVQVFPTYKPWLDMSDADNIFFASVQGYGKHNFGGWFYPGSGATEDTRPNANAPPPQAAGTGSKQALIPEDPNGEFTRTTSDTGGSKTPTNGSDPGPRIINVGVPGPGAKRQIWRRAWRDKILPALVNFNPDMIFVSAGFDAHRKEDINMRYVGIAEADYEWVTDQIMQVANRCCQGRVVSVLEGGYNLQGSIVSPFARSVAAHVRAMGEAHTQEWDPREAEVVREAEARKLEAKLAAAGGAPAAQPVAKAQETAEPAAPADARNAPEGAQKPAAAQGDANDGGGDSASAMAVDGESGGGGKREQPPVQEEEGTGKRRRRGAAVDYAQLNAELEAKKAAAGTKASE